MYQEFPQRIGITGDNPYQTPNLFSLGVFCCPRTVIGVGEMSHEKNPGWLGYTGNYTTKLYRDYNKPL